ncbi:GNAT family N-acetyltransferase [Dactylosporangium sp. NPDC051541]|uniref:GNAT family N-acetyltransferase n=1 Tax=Dactylosporangium sp. NPDC051541 TaxID=3363977 RepID=UPI0037AA1DE2
MTHAIQDVVVRDIDPVGSEEITDVLVAAMSDGAVARWLMPADALRRQSSPEYFAIFAEHAVHHGEVYASVDPIDGKLSGVALWFPLTHVIPAPVDYDSRLKDVAGYAYDRVCELDAALEAEHPLGPHHYLAFVAVRPDRQNLGIGSALLARHHARLDRAGLPAYLEANDPRNRELYLRHGYQSRRPIMLPDGPPVWPMWREPLL